MRFSCFNSHIHNHKSKKTVQPSIEAMHKSFQDSFQSKAREDRTEPKTLNPSLLKAQGDTQFNNKDMNVTGSSSVDQGWKSDEMKNKVNLENDSRVRQSGCLKKSQSLGSGLYLEGKISGNNDADDETDQGFSNDDSQDQNGLVVPDYVKDQDVSPRNLYQEDPPSESLQVSSDLMHNESIFSIGDPQHLEKEGTEIFDNPLSGDCDSGDHTLRTPRSIVNSHSVPDIRPHTSISAEGSPFACLEPRSRSSEDLHVLEMRRKENSIHEGETHVMQDQDGICKTDKNNAENPVDEGYDSYDYVGSAKDWIMPNPDEVNGVKNLQGESSVHRWHELPSKDFKTKRIEEWVLDLQHCRSLEETDEPSLAIDEAKRGSNILNGSSAAKMDAKISPGMEVAKRYISSLSANATTAQLSNHGLVVVPFLSAFVSLRVLNLSGNAIVRITAGALPRGLHMLNLSKNNISTIEGLRELTRLRILDLSYNRIFRIGHGLASCSSLKELYLAGNKISEVEGLHRLLKLNVLDLRFNKISTAKCLGQLAANYSSLQAISLEGNPAQKNVGDEQLKKYLHGLLPQLAYYNRQSIKVSTLKDAGDRSVRLGVGAHQFDRGLRSELKPVRKASHSITTAHKPSTSATYHGRKGQAVVSPKPSRGRHGRLPPIGTKAPTTHRNHYFDFGSKLLGFRPDLSMRRVRSEGTIGAL